MVLVAMERWVVMGVCDVRLGFRVMSGVVWSGVDGEGAVW